MREFTGGPERPADPRGGRGGRGGRGPSVRRGEVLASLWLLVRITVWWALLTGLGLVVLGIGPATVAAADVLLAARHGERVAVAATMWSGYCDRFVGANLRMVPLLVVEAGALAMVLLAAGGAVEGAVSVAVLGTLAAVSAGWALSALALIAAVPRVRDQDLLVTWRLALLLPAALPLRCALLSALVLLWTLLCWLVWPLAVLAGPAVPIALAVRLLARRTALLLEDLSGRPQPAGADAP